MSIPAADEIQPTLRREQGELANPIGANYTSWRKAIPLGHWMVVPVLLLAFFVRTQQISTVSVQWDESFCRKMVGFPWGEMFYRIILDTHPPLYYILLKIWATVFGNGIIAGRVLSAIFGVSGVLAMYLFVRAAYRRDNKSIKEDFLEADLPAVVAAMIMAVVPIQIIWSQQIRMYSLATALTLWSSYLLVRALRSRDDRAAIWIAYTIVATMLAYTHYYGLFALGAQYVYALGYRWSLGRVGVIDRVSPVMLSACGLSLAFQPWLPYFLEQRDRVDQCFHLARPSWELLGTTMHELWIGYDVPIVASTGLMLSQGFFVALLILLFGRRPADYLVFLSVAIPVIIAFALSMGTRSIISSRYFQINQVFLMVAMAVVACRIPSVGRFMAISLLWWGLFSPFQAHYAWRENAAQLAGIQAVATRLDQEQPNQTVLVCDPLLYTCVLSYTIEKDRFYLFKPPHGFVFFQGTAVIREEEYVDTEWIDETSRRSLWTVDWAGRNQQLPLNRQWKLDQEELYLEWYGSLKLRKYVRNKQVSSD